MTGPGPRPETPIAGLVELALTAPTFQQLIERAAARPAELSLVGPATARLFVTSALARLGSLLVVTATGREADDLTAELQSVFGDAHRFAEIGLRTAPLVDLQQFIHDLHDGSLRGLRLVCQVARCRSNERNASASVMCPSSICGRASISAIVRATFKTRW